MTLSQEEAGHFYRLMFGLQLFVGKEHHLLPETRTLQEYVTAAYDLKINVRDTLWKHPDVIERYVADNPHRLSAHDLGVVQKWQRFVSGKFIVFRHLREYTVFMLNSQVYGVLGLLDPPSKVPSLGSVPLMAQAVLLPFKGKIIYDGVVRTYDIVIGPGIRSGLNEEYARAKQRGEIVTTLEPELAPAMPVPRARGLDTQNEELVREIARMSEKLRGGTAVQSAALGVLRASARAAHSATQAPEDLDELRRLSRRVQTALKRLETTLDRAE